MKDTLFLERSYGDSIEYYEQCVKAEKYKPWDYVVVTAGGEEQAEGFRLQINRRLDAGLLDARTQYIVVPDCGGQRIGSGGGTLNALAELELRFGVDFEKSNVLLIHSGGDSKRIPQYSICGKLFSPIPRQTSSGSSALFDEILSSVSLFPERMKEGVVVASGDVMLLFNQLQIDFTQGGACAVSMAEDAQTGKNHGVFLTDIKGNLLKFLHKQTVEKLRGCGAVDGNGNVKIDTGIVYFDGAIAKAMLSPIKKGDEISRELFDKFINHKVRLNFYADFVYPLAADADYDEYLGQQGEVEPNELTIECRKKIWQVLSGYKMKVVTAFPAMFLHFGTTRERFELATRKIDEFQFLGWKKSVNSFCDSACFACDSLAVNCEAPNAYIEKSRLENCTVGDGTTVSYVRAKNLVIPSDVAMSGARLKDGRFVVRIYGVDDDIKAVGNRSGLFGIKLDSLPEKLREAFGSEGLWNAEIYLPAQTEEDAAKNALLLYEYARGAEIPDWWASAQKESAASSFEGADVSRLGERDSALFAEINDFHAVRTLERRGSAEAFSPFLRGGGNEKVFIKRISRALKYDYGSLIRLYYFAGRLTRDKKRAVAYDNLSFEYIAKQCAAQNEEEKVLFGKIEKDEICVRLPARVNFGGGWTDTPPYCIENGGTVLNCAVKIGGILPVRASVRATEERTIRLKSLDAGVSVDVLDRDEILNCANPFDPVALQKAALKVVGVVSGADDKNLDSVFEKLGGKGLILETEVVGIPRGSGLGTSSILSAACVKALYGIEGVEVSNEKISEKVFLAEQLMSTGGGWQDQIGGLLGGVKFIKSGIGVQRLDIEKVKIPTDAANDLKERFALIYTGQRRLARNLLREVVGGYLLARPSSVGALKTMERVACLMKRELERGDTDAFAALLSGHWKYSVMLDGGSSNSCIDHIFDVIEDFIDGKMICGAGGGGFLQVIMKKGVSRREMQTKLDKVFGGGVKVWDSELLLD